MMKDHFCTSLEYLSVYVNKLGFWRTLVQLVLRWANELPCGRWDACVKCFDKIYRTSYCMWRATGHCIRTSQWGSKYTMLDPLTKEGTSVRWYTELNPTLHFNINLTPCQHIHWELQAHCSKISRIQAFIRFWRSHENRSITLHRDTVFTEGERIVSHPAHGNHSLVKRMKKQDRVNVIAWWFFEN